MKNVLLLCLTALILLAAVSHLPAATGAAPERPAVAAVGAVRKGGILDAARCR